MTTGQAPERSSSATGKLALTYEGIEDSHDR
jgi:hypothetical protein